MHVPYQRFHKHVFEQALQSYQQLHINAIYGIDESEDLVIDSEGNEVPLSELNKPKTEEVVEEVKDSEVKEETPEAKEESQQPTEEKKTKKSTKKVDE